MVLMAPPAKALSREFRGRGTGRQGSRREYIHDMHGTAEIRSRENWQSFMGKTKSLACSTLYCQPIRFKYAKESRETILEEERFIKESKLRPTIFPGGFLCVHRKEIMMINGKVHTVLLGLSDSALICVVTGLQR